MPTLEAEIDWDWRPTATQLVVDYKAYIYDSPEWDDVEFIAEDGTREVVKYTQLTEFEQRAVENLVDADYAHKLETGYFDPDYDDREDYE